MSLEGIIKRKKAAKLQPNGLAKAWFVRYGGGGSCQAVVSRAQNAKRPLKAGQPSPEEDKQTVSKR